MYGAIPDSVSCNDFRNSCNNYTKGVDTMSDGNRIASAGKNPMEARQKRYSPNDFCKILCDNKVDGDASKDLNTSMDTQTNKDNY